MAFSNNEKYYFLALATKIDIFHYEAKNVHVFLNPCVVGVDFGTVQAVRSSIFSLHTHSALHRDGEAQQ